MSNFFPTYWCSMQNHDLVWFTLVRFKWNVRSLFGKNHIYIHWIDPFGVTIFLCHRELYPNHKIEVLSKGSNLGNYTCIWTAYQTVSPSCHPVDFVSAGFNTSPEWNLNPHIKFNTIKIEPLNFIENANFKKPLLKTFLSLLTSILPLK